MPHLILSKKLSELAPGIGNSKLRKVTYCLHGSLAVEGAMKLALKNRGGERTSFPFMMRITEEVLPP